MLPVTLEKLNADFLDHIGEELIDIGYPHHDIGMLWGEHDLYSIIDKVEPLPQDLVEALSAGDPSKFSVAQLDELRKRGKAVRELIANMRRKQADSIIKNSAKLKGKQLRKAQDEAMRIWMGISMSGGLDSVAACSNVSALMLQQKK